MKNKIIIFSLFFLIAAAGLGLSACNQKAKTVYTESGLCLQEQDDGYTICGIGTYEGTELVIPEKFEEKPVTRIGEAAFSGCGQIIRVTIPQSITWIGPSAFSGCKSLTEIEIPDSVTLIGNHAFSESGLTGITLPSSVVSLGDNAFRACKNLTQADIPGSVGELRWDVFSECGQLSEVTLGEGIGEIRAYAFSYCSSLSKVTLPESVISVGRYAFQYCDSLKSVFIPQKVASLGGYAFRGCSALDTFSIPQSVKSIGENAFWDTAFYNDPANWRNGALYLDGCLLKAKNSAKGEFTLEEGTRLIADKAAYGCEAISSLSISEETLYIGQEAFSGCDGLMSIQIFGGVVKFGRSVFYGCSNLEQIVIPDSVTWIGDQIFYGCDKIKTATMPISVIPLITKANLEKVVLTSGKEIGASAFSGAKNLTSVTLPDSVAKIGRSAFSDCSSLTEIAFPQGVTEIGESAFAGCRTLEEIVLPEGIEEIRSNTFASCVSLRSIMVPDRVTKIGSSAFNGCVRITQAKIGSGVKEIGSDAFENCYRLVEVWNRSGLTLQKGEEKNGKVCLYAKAVYLADESSRQTVTAEETLFYEDEEGAVLLDYYGNAAELSLPDHSPDGKDYAVYQKAFYGRDDLKNVTLGEGVTEIGKEAFYNCSNLLNVEFGNRLTVIGEGAFHNCNRLLHVEIPDSVTEIGKEAFYNCLNLTSVTLGSGTAKVGGSAFGNCYKLIEVYNRSALSVTRGESGNGRVAEYARNVYQAEGESRQIVKDGFLFYETEEECLLLAYIGEEEEIMLPQKSPGGKEYAIYQYAFAESNLHRVFLPKEMVEIGEKCFMNCNKLQAICYAGDVSEWKKVKGSSNISADLLYYYSETAPTQEQWKESGRWWHYTEENKAEEWEKPKV